MQQVNSFNLMFEDMYFTILGTYLVTEPPFVTSVFTLMGLSCVYIIIIVIAVQDVYKYAMSLNSMQMRSKRPILKLIFC